MAQTLNGHPTTNGKRSFTPNQRVNMDAPNQPAAYCLFEQTKSPVDNGDRINGFTTSHYDNKENRPMPLKQNGVSVSIGQTLPTDQALVGDKCAAVEQNRLVGALVASEAVEFDTLKVILRDVFAKKSPISALMELTQCMRSKVNFVEVGRPKGPDHKPTFTMVALVDGEPFTPVQAGNKKDCKMGAAYLAWHALLLQQQHQYKEQLDKGPADSHQQVALMVHLEYLKQVECNPQAYCGRKVLAGIVMCCKQKKGRPDIFKVISLGTGNRCIQSCHLDVSGEAVNDSHAEVIARRAFLRFLYKELMHTRLNSPESIFECPTRHAHLLHLKPNISFHLYISAIPCGDAALFSKNDEILLSTASASTALPVPDMSTPTTSSSPPPPQPSPPPTAHPILDPSSKEPIFTSKQQGLLRTKLEAGEGAIPVEKNYLQTLVGLQFGGRLRLMTCSDKICKWNVVGIQGALLAHFVHPIYLDSLTIGEDFMYGHVLRAFYFRLLHNSEEQELDIPLPEGFSVVLPTVGEAKIECGQQETEKSTSLTVSWCAGDEKCEVLDGTTGKLAEGTNQEPERADMPFATSNVCPRQLYTSFLALCEQVGRHDLLQNENYFFMKQSSQKYQQAKKALYEKFEALGYGQWVNKPVELDYFSAENNI